MSKRKFTKVSTVERNNLLDQYSPNTVGKIIPTTKFPRVNVFESYRPRKEQCLDYKISETFANFQKGDLKINVKETHATYEPLPPELCKKSLRKVKRFSGGPPQWEFVDEIWMRQRETVQRKVVQDLRHITVEKNKTRRKRKIKEHKIVQRLVGPEWFMELSPNQLDAIDQLETAINKDLDDRTVANTKEIIATLGLVLRPNRRHLEVALKHSCRSPVEFLLVLYQILDPTRETYSLNDRLILSAAVHLAIPDTLKELHIRVPSPPYEMEARVQRKVKTVKRQRYKSPYLQPQTFYPPPPKFSGVYENKHIQWPESPYFCYLPVLEVERKRFKSELVELRKNLTTEEKERWKEYDAVQNFYAILPGAVDSPMLLPASKTKICWNLLHKKARHRPPVIHLQEVNESDDEVCCCNCKELRAAKRADSLVKRSICDKAATKFIEKNLPCDACLEKELLKQSIKVMGGYARMTCPCDHVPVIHGVCLSKPCDCFIDYRNRVVVARAKQFLCGSGTKHVISGVTMSRFGPVYNFAATLGQPDCECHHIGQVKKWRRKEKEKLIKTNTKFVIGGVQITKYGPIYTLSNVVARKACGCIEKYRNFLIVAETQNQLRKNPAKFVIVGVVLTKQFGPVYSAAGAYEDKLKPMKYVCGYLPKKPKCLDHCQNHAEYADVLNKKKQSACEKEYPQISSNVRSAQQNEDQQETVQYESDNHENNEQHKCECSSSKEEDESSSDECTCTTSTQSSSSCTCEKGQNCSNKKRKKQLCDICQEREDNRYKYCGVMCKSDPSSEASVINPVKCKCQEELEKFMAEKCQCEDCLANIRRGYATHIHGGTKITPSGNTLFLVQGIHQPQCSCLHDHLKKIKQVEEYKSRAELHYKTMRRVDKYCISGVTWTKDGPVYNIGGLTPPVECDCALEMRRKQEEEKRLKRMPRPLNTGRVKYSVVGVKETSKENVYILGNAMDIKECDCMKMLRKFESAHEACVDEFDRFLERIEEEKNYLDKPDDEHEGYEDQDPMEETIDPGYFRDNAEYVEEDTGYLKVEEWPPENEGNTNDNIPEDTTSGSEKSCTCKIDRESDGTSSGDEDSSERSEEDSSKYDSVDSDSSDSEEYGHCSVPKAEEVTPIVLKDRIIPEYFMSKRYVIFKKMPRDKDQQEMILKHILKGMAEDGFPLAKLPDVYKLPIFKLWWEMRSGVFWTQVDRHKEVNRSIEYWKHSDFCYKEPEIDQLPFTQKDIKRLTWANAKMIRAVTTQYAYNYYRKVKQVTIATGREFFAPTFDYQFPTATWRHCAFAYIPTKEEAVFPYKIYQPHEARDIPKNKRFRCYC